jgi:type II restriction enzyme
VNFECADLICKFCGFLAQVKATRLPVGTEDLPEKIPSGAWAPQHARILAGIYHGLYVAGFKRNGRTLVRIDYVPPHVLEATPQAFEPRRPLSATAKRAGWRGYTLNLGKLPAVGMQRIFPEETS